MARWAWRALLWWIECVLERVLGWLQRNDVASLHIVPAEHTLGGSMELREGESLRVNVVAKNKHGRVLAAPANLQVSIDGVSIAPDADGSYLVAAPGVLRAAAGTVEATEAIVFVPDNEVASLVFVQAADGTQTPVEVPVTA